MGLVQVGRRLGRLGLSTFKLQRLAVMSVLAEISTYDKLKQKFPNQVWLTTEDIAAYWMKEPNTVRKQIQKGRMPCRFTREGGQYRFDIEDFANYVDGLFVEPKQDKRIAPVITYHQQAKGKRKMNGPGGRRLAGLQGVGFDDAGTYSSLNFVEVADRFEGRMELQNSIMKLGLWVSRMGLGVSHDAILDLAYKVEALIEHGDDVEASTEAFNAQLICAYNRNAGADNMESLLGLARYFSKLEP